MIIPELQRHLAVCGVEELMPILRRDLKFWNIVSIREPTTAVPSFAGAKKIHHALFHDTECEYAGEEEGIRAPTSADIAQILAFVDSMPGEPILIHCRAGVSRSTAVALTLIVRGHFALGATPPAEVLVDQILGLRRQAVPNCLILRLGLGLFLSARDAERLVREISNDPRLMQNRFINPQRE